MILLDTNVLSELMKPEPDPKVASWVSVKPKASLFISTVTQAEILYGLSLLSDGKRKDNLEMAARTMFAEDFRGRILPFDTHAAASYAEIASTRQLSGQPISQFDVQIAAIARSRGGSVATRNVEDFVKCGIDVMNPWEAT